MKKVYSEFPSITVFEHAWCSPDGVNGSVSVSSKEKARAYVDMILDTKGETRK